MDEEITYADLRQPAGCLSPAKQQHGKGCSVWWALTAGLVWGFVFLSVTLSNIRNVGWVLG